MWNSLLFRLFLIISTAACSAQVVDVPLGWDENAVEDSVTVYRIYHSTTSGGPWIEIMQIPVNDLDGNRLSTFEPRFVHKSVDFSGGVNHFYTASAQSVAGLESMFAVELRITTPAQVRNLRLER